MCSSDLFIKMHTCNNFIDPLVCVITGLQKCILISLQICKDRDFPCGTVVKNPPANAEDMGSSPGPGRSHMLWGS